MSAAAYAAFVRNAASEKSPALLGDFQGAWSRGESLQAVERIAARIDAASGERRNATIAIDLPRDRRFLATMLAAWARGDAFVPLNPRWPQAHRQRVLEIARPDLVVVAAERESLPGATPSLVLPAVGEVLALVPPDAAMRARWGRSRREARHSYAIFTSGSTGSPKGVLIGCHAYDAYRAWAGRYWPAVPGYRALLVTAELTFDITLGDIAFALAHDTEIHVSPDPGNVFAHAKMIRDLGIDVFYAVPSTIARLFPLALSRDDVRLDGLRLVVAGGDAFAPELIELVRRAAPRAEFHNVYGPTEVTINCAAARVDDQRERIAAAGMVPIGKPFDHLWARLEGEEPATLPGWTQGELLVGGAQCMEGYLGDAGATRAAFAQCAGERYYRTGDLVMRDPEGWLYVLGRKDSLVKVKGYRVSPASVDDVLQRHGAVAEARTIFARSAGGEGELLAFVVARREVTAGELMAACRAELPAYAVPARITLVESIPVGSSGKYDHARLLASLA